MLRSRIPQIIVEIEVTMQQVEEDAAERVQRDAKTRVPVRSGDLRDAIHTDREREGTYVVAGDDSDVFYGHMVEHGTTHSPPHPFLVPALEENRPGIIQDATARLRAL